MTTATAATIIIFANKWDGAICEVLAVSEKALQIRNKENGKSCWVPKSGIRLRKPGVQTYENEYEVNDWFFNKLSPIQMKTLNLAE